MPVILKSETWPAWLGGKPADPVWLKGMLGPHPPGEMMCWPASQRVGNVRNNYPSLIEPIAIAVE
jgi:putative SOS response-associated peptidase YedK